jgi:CheY-like chemotaxis protein
LSEAILIIDDDRAIAHLTSLRLAAAGHPTVIANGGHAGIEAAAKHRPALILLDIRMPDIDGFEVRRRLQQDEALADIPVIFLSANAHEAAREEAMAAGARAFLSKPCETADLISAVRAAVSNGLPEGKHAA